MLAKSSNICTAKIAAREGRDKLHEMLLRFGFGQRTGVDLPGERAGQVRSAERMGPVETATMSFGQGLTATPLQVAAAYAAIANGGTLYRPHVMRRVLSPEGQVVQEAPVVGERVISPELAETMRGASARGHAEGRHGAEAVGAGLPVRGQDRDGAEGRPGDAPLLADQLGGVVRRLRALSSRRAWCCS